MNELWYKDFSDTDIEIFRNTFPHKSSKIYDIERHDFTSLKGIPREINGPLCLDGNSLISLEFIPEKINGYLSLINTKITSLSILPKEINGNLYIYGNIIKGSLMDVFNVVGLTEVDGDSSAWHIINKYLPIKEGFDINVVKEDLIKASYYEEAGLLEEDIIKIKKIKEEFDNNYKKIRDNYLDELNGFLKDTLSNKKPCSCSKR